MKITRISFYPLLFMLLLFAGKVSAAFKGITLAAGESYYLYNVYQSKFLTYGNAWGTQCSVDLASKNPLLCTIETDGSGYRINSHFSLTSGAYNATVNNYLYVADGIPVVNANWGDSDTNPNVRTPQTWNLTPVDEGYNITYTTDGVTYALMFDAGSACTVGVLSDGYNADKSIWKLISVDEFEQMRAKKMFTTCALNVDGLPYSIKIAGVYDLKLNEDSKGADGATAIGQKLTTMGYDVIGVSEDFTYNTEIVNQISSLYGTGTYRGGLNVTASTYTKYLGKESPLFDTDGLNLFYRTAAASISNESWTHWNEHYGYTDDGADGMIDKGYRYYTITLTDGTQFDLYILHMDAEDSDADNAARKTQIKQLADAILATHNGRPIVVMGDTNCRYTRDPLKTDFIDYINADSRFTVKDCWVEHARGGIYPAQGGGAIMVSSEGYRRGEVVDKVFYINNTESDIRIQPEMFRQDISFINDAGEPLADHWPMVVDFSYHAYDPLVDDATEENLSMEGVYLRNRETGAFLKAGGWWGTHAVQGTYGSPMTLSQLPSGKYVLQSNIGYVSQGDPYMDASTQQSWNLLTVDGYYVLAYEDGSNLRALTGNDPTFFPATPGPNTRYVTTAVLNTADHYQQWEILTKEDLLDEMQYATASQPYNATFLLSGANFDRNDGAGKSAWSGAPVDATRMSSNLCDGRVDHYIGNSLAEVYVSNCPKTHAGSCSHGTTWDVKQNLTGLPSGTYRVTCQAFQRISNSTSTTATIQVYATGGSEVSAQVPLMYTGAYVTDSNMGSTQSGNYYYPNSMAEATNFFNEGYYVTTLNNVSVTNGSLTVGVRKTSDTGKSNNAWTCFDNFQLYYYPNETFLRGDLNNDKVVSLRDIPMLVDYLNGRTSPYNRGNSDVNGDHKRNNEDVEILTDKILGK